MAATASGADVLANSLLVSLTANVDFTIPDVDLDDPAFDIPPASGDMYLPVAKLTAADLTTGQVGGTGMFDQLMVSLVNHLKVEYAANRIAGAEYTKAYIGVIGAALQTAQQYLLAKDQSYWQAILVQQQARVAEIEVIKARVELETAKAMLIRTQYEAHTAEAQYGLTKMQIANADIAYEQTDAQVAGILYTNENLLPAQLAHTQAETSATTAQTVGITYTNTNLLPAQLAQSTATTAGITYTNTDILPAQKTGIDRTNANLASTGIGISYTNTDILPQQRALLKEQSEVQAAQTAELRIDGVPVAGLVGKQKALYEQQITSYKRDGEQKLAKLYGDAWITQKTIDEGYPAPPQFSNTEIDEVIRALRSNLGLGG